MHVSFDWEHSPSAMILGPIEYKDYDLGREFYCIILRRLGHEYTGLLAKSESKSGASLLSLIQLGQASKLEVGCILLM